ncbi:TPA: hypothetical protein DCF80_03140 [Candidatus Saccharibacteria bacterium]|nr:hypothetical protein [Candidatus Saccharibacteria bacterium]HRK40807.1 HAMP domain-containing sensor histidine kinase [Candidatus Saccharibacteria bacterium]
MNDLFDSATLKLTGWYLLILMMVSLLFSGILYGISSNELRRSLRAPGQTMLGLFVENDAARELRESRYKEGQARVLGNLIVLNVSTLVAGGGVSYLLARRTLRPIREAMEAQSRFTSDASHELRTPLAIMRSEIEVGLRDKSATKKDYKELLESNLDEVERLRELSDRLLLLASERELPLDIVSLDEISIEALNRVIKPAQLKKIDVVNEVSPIMVRANLEAMADVVTVLLDNALKYSDEKTTVTIHSELRGRTAILSVTDQGHGIEGDDLPRIFDRFYRVDGSRSRQHVEGHGLGLSIAKRIVDQHGGQLNVQSEPGRGATFSIRLLLAS